MHSIDDLHFYGLEVRQTNAFKRAGLYYVEDLLGTSPWKPTAGYGPEEARDPDWTPPYREHRLNVWYAYCYRDAWLDLPSVGKLAVARTQYAIAQWQRVNRGVPVTRWENPLRT